MPFVGAEGSGSNSWTGGVDCSDSTAMRAPALGVAPTWPLSAASSSSAPSLIDSSAPAHIEINLVSSPPTSHATSPSRVQPSPLRPSSRDNVVVSPSVARAHPKAASHLSNPARGVAPAAYADAYVANSDPEDGGHEAEASGTDTPQMRRSPSPPHVEPHAVAEDVPETTVYVQLPASSPVLMTMNSDGGARKKAKTTQQEDDSPKPRRRTSNSSGRSQPSSSSTADDAALAAALAAQEAVLARRRPTRSARKEVSYQPLCDLEGRPLPPKKVVTSQASSSTSTSKDKATSKRTSARKSSSKRASRTFSDDEDEDGNEAGDDADSHRGDADAASRPSRPTEHSQGDHDADLTDEDIGFQGRDRRKARKNRSLGADSQESKTRGTDGARAEASVRGSKRKSRASREDEEEVEAQESDGSQDAEGDGILTPPAPESPRRSSRPSVPSPKKLQSTGSADKTQHDTVKVSGSKRRVLEETVQDEEEGAEEGDEAASAVVEADGGAGGSESAVATPLVAASVAIKRIGATGSPSPAGSASPRSFFGKPLTTLLTSGAVRRPGLTRKTKIPSLLAHRGAPKPPAPQLAASKRRMQDDDYEYDPDYEALIAKNKPDASDDDDDDDDELPPQVPEEEVEYD